MTWLRSEAGPEAASGYRLTARWCNADDHQLPPARAGGLTQRCALRHWTALAALCAAVRAALANPYALAPLGQRTGPAQPEVTWPEYDEEFESWLATFVMAVINVRVVLRSHALLGQPWGHDFTYGESMMTGDGLTGRAAAGAMSATMASVMTAGRLGPVRSLFERFMPAPGQGPSPEQQSAGFFDIRFHGRVEGTTTHHLGVTVTGDRDPGYGSTAKMFVEAAAELVDADVGGGFWTPSTALGQPYLERLVEHAGLTFEVN